MKKLLLLITALFLTFSLFGFGRGDGPSDDSEMEYRNERRKEMREKHDARFNKLLLKIGVTEDVIIEIKEIKKESREKNMELRKDIKELRKSMQNEIAKDNPNEQLLFDFMNKLAEIKKEMIVTRGTAKIRTALLLTPDQRKEMRKYMQKHKRRKHRKMF